LIKAPDYFDTGNGYLSIILARLRHTCINGDLFRVNIINSALCICGFGLVIHTLLWGNKPFSREGDQHSYF